MCSLGRVNRSLLVAVGIEKRYISLYDYDVIMMNTIMMMMMMMMMITMIMMMINYDDDYGDDI